jgi:hypothetical protein
MQYFPNSDFNTIKLKGLLEACKNGDKLKSKHYKALFIIYEIASATTDIRDKYYLLNYSNPNFYSLEEYIKRFGKNKIRYLKERISQNQMIKLLKNNPELIEIFL